MYRTAQPSCAIQNRTASSVKVFREMWNRRSPPFIRSTTMYLVAVSKPHSTSDWHHIQVLDVLEAVAQVAKERMVEMLEHASLADNVTNTLRAHNYWPVSVADLEKLCYHDGISLTFIFPDILEGKGEPGVLALDDAHLAKGTLADNTQ
jgi:hypothetical protein